MKKDKKLKVKIPFHPIVIVLFCVMFTFLVGGIAAGLNWTRLSRPKWKYPTIGITVGAFVLYVYIYSHIPIGLSNYIVYISYGVFIVVGFAIFLIQKPYYDRWKLGKL